MKVIKPFPEHPVKAVIFDFDGTLVDSEPVYLVSDRRLLKKYKINLTFQEKAKYIGGSSLDMMKDFKKKYKLKETVAELLRKKNIEYLKLAEKKLRPFPKVVKLLNSLGKKPVKLAIASGSSKKVLTKLLSNLSLLDRFEIVLSAEEVKRGKPFPDIFIEAAKRLKVPAKNILVIEDTLAGVMAAKKAKMNCVVIPDISLKPLDKKLFKADLVFEKGMKEFDHKKVLSWMRARFRG